MGVGLKWPTFSVDVGLQRQNIGDAMTLSQFMLAAEPYYRRTGDEIALFEAAYADRMPMMLKGPTGCGKTRFIEYMAWRLGRPLITVACHEDMTGSDLVGRFLLDAEGTRWHDGPLTLAVKEGAICYLDEIVEARQDTTVLIHPLTDERRVLPIDKRSEQLAAHTDFQLVISYNPGYQSVLKDLKESTRQRMVALSLTWAPPDVEAEIVAAETGIAAHVAQRLVALAGSIRTMDVPGLREVASTRTLVTTAHLHAEGVSLATAAHAAIGDALTDDPRLTAALGELIDAWLTTH